MEVARADAEKIKLIGGSEATAIEAVGKAEAERMRLKASAYKQYGDAAMLSLVLETLPKVAFLMYIYKFLFFFFLLNNGRFVLSVVMKDICSTVLYNFQVL